MRIFFNFFVLRCDLYKLITVYVHYYCIKRSQTTNNKTTKQRVWHKSFINTLCIMCSYMTKVQFAVCLEIDQIGVLDDMVRLYRLKNRSNAIDVVIKQWQNLTKARAEQQKKITETLKKPSNPMVSL